MGIYLLGEGIKVSSGGGSVCVRAHVCVCVVAAVMVCVHVCVRARARVCVGAGGAFVCVCVRLCASIIGESVCLCVCVVVAAIAWWWRPLYALLFVCVYACADAQSAQKIHSPAPQSLHTSGMHAPVAKQNTSTALTYQKKKEEKCALHQQYARTWCVRACMSAAQLVTHTRPGEWW